MTDNFVIAFKEYFKFFCLTLTPQLTKFSQEVKTSNTLHPIPLCDDALAEVENQSSSSLLMDKAIEKVKLWLKRGEETVLADDQACQLFTESFFEPDFDESPMWIEKSNFESKSKSSQDVNHCLNKSCKENLHTFSFPSFDIRYHNKAYRAPMLETQEVEVFIFLRLYLFLNYSFFLAACKRRV